MSAHCCTMSLARHATRLVHHPPSPYTRLLANQNLRYAGPQCLSTFSTVTFSSSNHDRKTIFFSTINASPPRQLSAGFVFYYLPQHQFLSRSFSTTPSFCQSEPQKPKRENAGQETAEAIVKPTPATAEVLGEPQESLFQRFKKMAKQYWYVLIPVHIVTTCFWVGGFYALAKSGLDLASILDRLGAPEVLMKPVRNSNAGYYAVTYACYKLATPLRYVVTIGGTTVVVRYLTRFGYLKPMPNKKELSKMYHERVDNFANRQKAWRKRLDDINWRLKVKERLKGKRKS